MKNNRKEIVVFGGGCFWCTEAIFKNLKGVISVTPGYAGGTTPNPTYYQICEGNTGHAEVIKIEFNPEIIPYKDLLEIFFYTHNPTTLNRQGNDSGTQYRSIVLYTNTKQKEIALKFINNLVLSKTYEDPIITQIKPLTNFYEAEDYHKNYYQRNSDQPYCQIIISPKLKKLSDKYYSKLNV